MNHKVSIIIPVYNAVSTLERCVESIVYGNLREIEVILVEDHSTDDSWNLCRGLSDRYPKVRAVRNDCNRGVSHSRNHGLEEATGEYVLFVDSDDWVSEKYAKELCQTAMENTESFTLCGFRYIDKTVNTRRDYLFEPCQHMSFVNSSHFMALHDCVHLQVVWNKLFRMDIIRKNGLRFDESISMGEDFQFVLDYLEQGNIRQCAVINQPLYYYIRYNNMSLMRNFARDPIANGEKRMRQLARICGDPDLAEQEIRKLRDNYTYHIARDRRLSRDEKLRAIAQLWPDGSGKKKLQEQTILFAKETLVRLKSYPGTFFRRVRGRLQREAQQRKIRKFRKQLKQTDFTILSQNCIGGVFYHDMGLKFATPTVNLYFDAPDFLRFVLNLDYYLAQPLEMHWGEEYPIGTLDDVTIHFMHYETCTRAKEAWERRVKRIHRQNLVILCTDRNGFGPQEYEMWKQVPSPKLLFTANPTYTEDSLFFQEYTEQGYVDNLIDGSKFYMQNRLTEILESL